MLHGRQIKQAEQKQKAPQKSWLHWCSQRVNMASIVGPLEEHQEGPSAEHYLHKAETIFKPPCQNTCSRLLCLDPMHYYRTNAPLCYTDRKAMRGPWTVAVLLDRSSNWNAYSYLECSVSHGPAQTTFQHKTLFGTYISLIIQHLDLSRVTEFDHCTDRYLKLPTGLQVQPDIVALGKEIKD